MLNFRPVEGSHTEKATVVSPSPNKVDAQTREAIKQRIKRALHRTNQTGAEAARKAGISNDMFYKSKIRGSVPRDKETRESIARALNVNPTWLWTGEGSERPGENDETPMPALVFAPDTRGYFVEVPDGRWRPAAKPGDLLWVTPSYPPKVGDEVFAQAQDTDWLGELVALTRDQASILLPDGRPVQLPTKSLRLVQGRVRRTAGGGDLQPKRLGRRFAIPR